MTRIVLNMSGSRSAVPIAWMTRASIRMLNTGAIAAMNVPMIENTSDTANSCLVVNHCRSNPEIGTNIPRVNKYPVVSH
ncbi:Uncharacterised protein [Mycobacteroides abscessus subsp. abscessus]|nr:Uncharacterised protein [Mycobacteroides abscessus subsp. abscessus]